MKKILFSFALLSGLILSDGDVLQRDPLILDQTQITDKHGRSKGYIKKDSLIRDQFQIFDSQGKQTGTIKRDPFFRDRWSIDK